MGKFNSKTSKIAKVIGAAKVPLIDNGTRAARSVQQCVHVRLVPAASQRVSQTVTSLLTSESGGSPTTWYAKRLNPVATCMVG